MNKRAFTLVELLIVIAILATLGVILALILNPVEYLRRARDAQRLQDYAAINSAIDLLRATESNLDHDGPLYPASTPPQTGSCVSDAATPDGIFVSVPGSETSPTPPVGWEYKQVAAGSLHSVDGNGWLPINFADPSLTVQPLAKLPVDPINTFASGYYYTYVCGSYELNLRFESQKYQELAKNDSGNESLVYEIGSRLDVAPTQTKYQQAIAGVGGAATLLPNANATDQWISKSTSDAAYEIVSNLIDADYIYTNTANQTALFQLENPTVTFNNISRIRVYIKAGKGGAFSAAIIPVLKLGAQEYTGNTITLSDGLATSIIKNGEFVTTVTGCPFTSCTSSDIANLQAGVRLSGSNRADVTKIRVEVDYTF